GARGSARVGAPGGSRRLPRAGRGGGEPDRRRPRQRRLPQPCLERPDRARRRALPPMRVELTVNGERREADAWAGESLLYVLRERLGLPGSKNACEQGECGSCSVLSDGRLVCACAFLAAPAGGHERVTLSGLGGGGCLP